jgi:aspartate carbamoyltransferase regulatory subunit
MLDVVKNKVQIVIRVPGGARLVKDVITIRSRRLKEDQELELIFGQTRE